MIYMTHQGWRGIYQEKALARQTDGCTAGVLAKAKATKTSQKGEGGPELTTGHQAQGWKGLLDREKTCTRGHPVNFKAGS